MKRKTLRRFLLRAILAEDTGLTHIRCANLPFCAASLRRLEPVATRESTGLSPNAPALSGSRPVSCSTSVIRKRRPFGLLFVSWRRTENSNYENRRYYCICYFTFRFDPLSSPYFLIRIRWFLMLLCLYTLYRIVHLIKKIIVIITSPYNY